ncbi:MAG: glutamyl-tRNA reductase [Saprospiraceae bacterium]|nr:glutamyl-tRNA reductase [Saprospiraceae bacterium]
MHFVLFMIDNYKVITFTHHVVEIAEIGNYQIVESSDGLGTHRVKSALGLEEFMYLSTCNRVTYIFYTHQEVNIDFIIRLLKEANPSLTEEGLDRIERYVSLYEGVEAIQHIFEVAGSIDSLVVGESEIFRQFRAAYQQALEAGQTGDNLRLLEIMAVQVAKHIYSHTRINEKPLSIAALAGESILEVCNSQDACIALVGAGETNTLVARFLHKHGYHKLLIFNRSIDKAIHLAEEVGGKAFGLEALPRLENFDALVVCTSSQQPIVTPELWNQWSTQNKNRYLLVDLAVPANVDARVGSLPNVNYINIDQLRELADRNLNFRRQEISIAKTIVDEAVEQFKTLYMERQVELALSALPEEVKKVKEKITTEVFRHKLDLFSAEQKEVIDEILSYMESKCIGIPMKLAKKTIKF